MKRMTLLLTIIFVLFLTACGDGDNAEEETEELATLDVEFNLPETAEPGETIELEAIVTYGNEVVEDAEEVLFEYWLAGEEVNSEEVEGEHTEGGRYVAEVDFPEDGIYELYAHTTAKGLHTMPLKSIAVGDIEEDEHADHDPSDHGFHTEGFDMHLTELENVTAGEAERIEVNITLDEAPLKDADVRYEIWSGDDKDNTEWVDAEEDSPGRYLANHAFEEVGVYYIQVHVENDDLHEHVEYEVDVEE